MWRWIMHLLTIGVIAGVGVSGWLLGIKHSLETVEYIEVDRFVPMVEPCPPYVPHTPLTEEDLVGLAAARDAQAAKHLEALEHAGRVEALLRKEIADLKNALRAGGEDG